MFGDFNDSMVLNGTMSNLTTLAYQQHMDSIMAAFHASLYTYREPRTILLITLYLPVFLLALFGNLLVLLVILTTRHMRSLTNYFLLNLSIADLLGEYSIHHMISQV